MRRTIDSMKTFAKRIIVASGALRLASRLREPGAAILMYHSTLPDPSIQADTLGEMIHPENVFRAQMELLARDFHPISLDELYRQIQAGGRLPNRSVVVTFDDGYADNYEVAMPILNKTGVPATFYATVDCIENRKLPWPARLRFAFRNTKLNTSTNSAGEPLPLKNSADKEQAFLAACDICCQLSGAVQDEFVRRIEEELEISIPSTLGSLMMNFDQLRALTRHGHIVASHTVTHPNMAYVDQEKAHQEFSDSKRRLESELGLAIKHFAYPCPALSPHWTERTLEQCRVVGYETAVTTDWGLMRKEDNPLCMKRIPAQYTVEALRWDLECAHGGRTV